MKSLLILALVLGLCSCALAATTTLTDLFGTNPIPKVSAQAQAFINAIGLDLQAGKLSMADATKRTACQQAMLDLIGVIRGTTGPMPPDATAAWVYTKAPKADTTFRSSIDTVTSRCK